MNSPKQADCLFCQFAQDSHANVQKLYEDEVCFVIADKFPLLKNHLLVIPKNHHALIDDYSSEEQLHLHRILLRTQHALLNSHPKYTASNILLNNGKASGQHIPHTHWHIIPRKRFDTLCLGLNALTRFINPFNYIRTSNINFKI